MPFAQYVELAFLQRDRPSAVRVRNGDRGQQVGMGFEELGVDAQVLRDILGT